MAAAGRQTAGHADGWPMPSRHVTIRRMHEKGGRPAASRHRLQPRIEPRVPQVAIVFMRLVIGHMTRWYWAGGGFSFRDSPRLWPLKSLFDDGDSGSSTFRCWSIEALRRPLGFLRAPGGASPSRGPTGLFFRPLGGIFGIQHYGIEHHGFHGIWRYAFNRIGLASLR
jgi:hypothetical protein